MILLNTTAGSSRRFHDEVINSNFGELIICIFLLCGLWWGKKKWQSQSKSLALSCSWHTLAEDMSVEKCETIHKAPHAPTLKYYRETFKWKTSNKLQLRCLWHSALSWAPYHCSAYSSQYCFSREGKRKTSGFPLFHRLELWRKKPPQTPMMGYLWIWQWCYWHGCEAEFFTVEHLCSCLPAGPTPVSAATLREVSVSASDVRNLLTHRLEG